MLTHAAFCQYQLSPIFESSPPEYYESESPNDYLMNSMPETMDPMELLTNTDHLFDSASSCFSAVSSCFSPTLHMMTPRKNSKVELDVGLLTLSEKRRNQVKVACIHCKKACKKCDESRPCMRCIRLGLIHTCRNAPRKERKKGLKRGPYQKSKV